MVKERRAAASGVSRWCWCAMVVHLEKGGGRMTDTRLLSASCGEAASMVCPE